jgi:hypothetical protein
MSGSPKDEEKFDDQEARRRFEAALRGARIAEPHPMKDIPPKWPRADRGHKRKRRDELIIDDDLKVLAEFA